MKERPIIMTGESVRAILEGRKSQTRRVIKPQPVHRVVEGSAGLTVGMDQSKDGALWYDTNGIDPGKEMTCPYGVPGDRLWVKETYATQSGMIARKATDALFPNARWQSPLFMPRWASRITLEMVDVRVQRVQETSESDANSEGFPSHLSVQSLNPAKLDYAMAWDSINAKRGYPWDSNPYVWVIAFKRV